MQASSLYMEGRKDPYKLSASMQEYILKKGLLFAVIFDELRQYIWCGMEICDSDSLQVSVNICSSCAVR